MAFPKGQPRPAGAGRQPGSPNKTTRTVRGAFIDAFEKLGGADALATWALNEPTEFYKLASKLIPTELSGQVKTVIEIIDPTKDDSA